ncbi:hypothetical protein BKA82DRAFT_4104486 [Pisolithus tinctorius]|nr:hypothetical protein BKA82DRAFT_4104486 [Pisolithus tinctorius]
MASSELLKQIQAGKKLRKAETNDRSAPMVETKSGGGGMVGAPGVARASSSPVAARPSSGAGGPPQLGNLFAGGLPKLKPAGQNNLAKPPTFGKPPLVPKRGTPAVTASTAPPSRPTPPRPPTAPPAALPGRPAPALPSRSPGSVSTRPTLPPRATPSPPPSVSVTPPSPTNTGRSPPPVSGRSSSPTTTAISSPARAVPPLPTRNNGNSPVPPVRRAPPPPATPGRPAPPPSTQAVFWKYAGFSSNGPPAPPARVRALSEVEPPAPPPPGPSPARASLAQTLTSAPHRPRVVSGPPKTEPRTSVHGVVNGNRQPPPTRRIPSPPPTAGGHTFPVDGFPTPRPFVPGAKSYGGGRQRGSDFDLSNLE